MISAGFSNSSNCKQLQTVMVKTKIVLKPMTLDKKNIPNHAKISEIQAEFYFECAMCVQYNTHQILECCQKSAFNSSIAIMIT